MFKVNVMRFGLAVSARVFSTQLVWRQEPDDSFIIAFAPMSDLQNQDFEKLRLELHELRYQMDEAAENAAELRKVLHPTRALSRARADNKLNTQRLEEQVALLHASIEQLESRATAILSIKNALGDDDAASEAIRGALKGFLHIKPLAPEGKRAAEPAREQRARLTGFI